jgi:hypothetical protein
MFISKCLRGHLAVRLGPEDSHGRALALFLLVRLSVWSRVLKTSVKKERPMRKTIILTLAVAGLLWATSASAGPVVIGQAGSVQIGSWMLTNVIENAPNMTKMEAFITSGNSTFDGLGWGALNYGGAVGWTSQVINPTYAVATGTAVNQQWLTNRFTSNIGTMVVWDILAYDASDNLIDSFRMWSDGTGTVWSQYNNTPFTGPGGWDTQITGTYDRHVPDGGTTLMLLGGALVGLAALRRKFNV